MWAQLKPPVKRKELELLLQRQGTCLISKFIVSYESGAKIGRLIPNGFASCLYHNGKMAILEDGIIAKSTVLDQNIVNEMHRMYQPVQLSAKEECIKIQEYITGLYESSHNKVEWITLKNFLNSYNGYIRNAERLPDPQRLEHTIYRKIKESLEIWDSVMKRPF